MFSARFFPAFFFAPRFFPEVGADAVVVTVTSYLVIKRDSDGARLSITSA